MLPLPRLALSIRQPWAWAIIHAGKDIENRSWRRPNPGLRFGGRFAVHAAQGMTRDEYEEAADFMTGMGILCPPPAKLDRGGIVGVASVAGIVRSSESPWFFGPIGLVLTDAEPVEFIRVGGALGFFEWKPIEDARPATPKWMVTWGNALPEPDVRQGGLF